MTEDEARRLIVDRWNVSRGTLDKLEAVGALVVAETQHQNLISASTICAIWTRHILDSLQLTKLAPPDGAWLDIGSGAGFPGLVVAIVRQAPMILVEPRRLRATFLENTARALDLPHVRVVGSRIEAVEAFPAAVISARAFASLDRTLAVAHRFATADTVWILPKGRSAHEELAAARESWQGDFQSQHSLTDRDARLIVARHVSPKGKT